MSLAESAKRFAEQTASWDEALEGGEIFINNVKYAAAVTVGKIEPRNVDGQLTWSQSILVSIRKTLHPTEPASRGVLMYKNQSYNIAEISGHEDTEVTWDLVCHRWR